VPVPTFRINSFLVLFLAWGFISAGFINTDWYNEISVNNTELTSKHANDPYLIREFTLEGPGILHAYTFSGNIDVIVTEDTQNVRVEVYLKRGYSFWSGSKDLDNYRITVKQNGNKIISSAEKKSGTESFFSDQVTFSYKIYVPVEMSAELKTSAGDITMSGVKGNHSVKSNAGNISITGSTGHIEAFTSGGNIKITDSRGTIFGQTNGGNITLDNNKGELRFKSDGGEIIAQRISGSMLSQVRGGDIKAQFEHVSKGVSLETSAGDILVALPGNEGFDINLLGTDVMFSNELRFQGEQRKGKAKGQIMGGGVPVNLTTGYGEITLKVNNNNSQ